MSIRPFSRDDYPKILEIYSRTKLDELQFESETFELLPLEKDATRHQKLIASETFIYDDGQVRGFGAFEGREITALFVLPNERGAGVGRRLLEFMLARVPDNAAILYVASSNHPAKALYRSCGFRTVETFETSYNGVCIFADKMEL